MFPFETSNAHKSATTKLRTDAPVMNVPAFNIAISKSTGRSRAKEFPLVLPTKKRGVRTLQGNRLGETLRQKLPTISPLCDAKNSIARNNVACKPGEIEGAMI